MAGSRVRGAVITRSLLLTLLLATGACEREAVRPKAEPMGAAMPDPTAVNPSDAFCLGPEALRAEPIGSEAIRARYRHWTLCDYNLEKATPYLDALVAENDPAALHEKGLLLRDIDPAEAARLQAQAERLGWRQRTRRDEMDAIATPPS